MNILVKVKPLSINDATKGRHFPTKAKTQFCNTMRLILPNERVVGLPYYRVRYDFHLVRFATTDWDNLVKITQDCLVERGIITDDRLIIEAHVRKFKAREDSMMIEIVGIAGHGEAE